jgi:ketosteroid isomerase-like protein
MRPRSIAVGFVFPLLMSNLFAAGAPDAAGVPGSAVVGKGAPPADVAAVADAERAFATIAREKGVRDAFVETAAEDALLLRPGPVNAKEFMGKRPSNAGPLLAWGPSYVELSASGELAWDTGPWSFSPDRTKPAVAWGHFATVWRKDPDGVWRWVLDHGHDMPAAGPDEPLQWGRTSRTAKGAAPKAAAPDALRSSLGDADRAYGELLAKGGLAAGLGKFAAADVRVYREGHAPARGAAAHQAFAGEWKGGIASSEPHVGAVSKAGDLGYTYGTIALADTSVSHHGRNYMRVWRNAGPAGWRLALDVVNEIPPPPPPPAAPAAPSN